MLDNLTKLCIQIEACRKRSHCDANGIVCTKKFVTDYIGNDDNKILELKAQIMYHKETDNEYKADFAVFISLSAFIVSIMNIQDKDTAVGYGIFVLLIILFMLVIEKIFYKKNRARQKWMRYVEVVLEEKNEN